MRSCDSMCVEVGWYLGIVFIVEALVECHDICFSVSRLVHLLYKAVDVFEGCHFHFRFPCKQSVQHF